MKAKKSPRQYKAEAGILNIVSHPHTPELYAGLFRAAKQLDGFIRVFGDSVAMISTMSRYGDTDEEGLHGEIFRFTDLRKDDPWFDTQTGDEATTDQLSLVSIPDRLKPHLKRTRYAFFPKRHRLVFERKRSRARSEMSPAIAAKLYAQRFGTIHSTAHRTDTRTHFPMTHQLHTLSRFHDVHRLRIGSLDEHRHDVPR